MTIAAAVADRFAAARTDSGLFGAGLFVEEVAALAYRAAAAGPLRGEDRALALRFAGHEHEGIAMHDKTRAYWERAKQHDAFASTKPSP